MDGQQRAAAPGQRLGWNPKFWNWSFHQLQWISPRLQTHLQNTARIWNVVLLVLGSSPVEFLGTNLCEVELGNYFMGSYFLALTRFSFGLYRLYMVCSIPQVFLPHGIMPMCHEEEKGGCLIPTFGGICAETSWAVWSSISNLTSASLSDSILHFFSLFISKKNKTKLIIFRIMWCAH